MRPGGWTDQQVDEIIGNLLRAGVILAAAVVLLGGVLYLAQSSSTLPDYRVFRGESESQVGIRSNSLFGLRNAQEAGP